MPCRWLVFAKFFNPKPTHVIVTEGLHFPYKCWPIFSFMLMNKTEVKKQRHMSEPYLFIKYVNDFLLNQIVAFKYWKDISLNVLFTM